MSFNYFVRNNNIFYKDLRSLKRKIFLSQKLVTFLHNTDYYIDEEIEFGVFVNKINYMLYIYNIYITNAIV